jgi:microcystin-dependent protein
MSDLSTNTINNTYKSVLNVGTVPNSTLTTSLCVITDGMNNQSSLSISTANNGAKVTGPFSIVGTISASNFDIPTSSGAFQSILNTIYPINSVYFTSSNASFASFLGFTWVQISQGRFIAGIGTGTDKNGNTFTVGTSDTTGEYTHRLSASELPPHEHTIKASQRVTGDDAAGGSRVLTADRNITTADLTITGLSAAGKSTPATAHNNIPPYFGLYIWCRVA